MVTDSISGAQMEIDHYRLDGFNSFLQVGMGVLFKFKKRNMLVSLLYAQGLERTYKLDLVYRENNKQSQSLFIGHDSFVSLQIRLFLKNREASDSGPQIID